MVACDRRRPAPDSLRNPRSDTTGHDCRHLSRPVLYPPELRAHMVSLSYSLPDRAPAPRRRCSVSALQPRQYNSLARRCLRRHIVGLSTFQRSRSFLFAMPFGSSGTAFLDGHAFMHGRSGARRSAFQVTVPGKSRCHAPTDHSSGRGGYAPEHLRCGRAEDVLSHRWHVLSTRVGQVDRPFERPETQKESGDGRDHH
jgi:hypothetical protein